VPTNLLRRCRSTWYGTACAQARLRRVAAFLAAGLEQEPGAALGLVDEGFEQARGAGILVVVASLWALRIAAAMCLLSSINSRSISRGGT
jgi:hypothetical protein